MEHFDNEKDKKQNLKHQKFSFIEINEWNFIELTYIEFWPSYGTLW